MLLSTDIILCGSREYVPVTPLYICSDKKHAFALSSAREEIAIYLEWKPLSNRDSCTHMAVNLYIFPI